MLQFWVQIHGLELEKFSEQNVHKIGKSIRKVIEIDGILGLQGLDRDYVRIKVEIDATKALLVGLWYMRRNGGTGRA